MLVVFTIQSSYGQTATWGSGIACLLYTHCTPCHHDNGIAPFSLTTYADAYSHMALISHDVNNHIMPPYPADVTYQSYIGERYLSAQELSMLNAWIGAGGPEGDSAVAPATPTYASGPVITNPGFTARIPTYTVPQLSSDLYRDFIISNPSTQTQFVTGIEVIPGNPSAVHHVLVYADTSSIPVQRDSADSGPGYTEFSGDGSLTAEQIGGWTPGSEPSFTPAGMGIEIQAGSRIIIQVHYPAGSSGMTDSTRINLQFSSSNNLRKVSIAPVLNYYQNLTNGPLVIPANTIDTFYEQYTVPAKVTLISIAPHSHLICTYMKCFGVEPNGDTIPLVSDAWNFHWQGTYPFKKPIVIPAGTVLHGQAIYTNTEDNALNPNFPPQQVVAGESTTNEMMIFFFSYTPYQAGDESAVYDTTTFIHTYDNCDYSLVAPSAINEVPQIKASVFPNPTSGIVDLNLGGVNGCLGYVNDITGNRQLGLQLSSGYNRLDISSLANGLYFITLVDSTGNSKPQMLRIVKQ